MSGFAIDVVLRTYNRAHMLDEAVGSLFAADRRNIALRLMLVDNASTDATPETVRHLCARYDGLIVPLRESKPGGQHALNCGIAAATAPVVAFFDDDERVAEDWLQVIAREFADPATDFIGGPYKPLWSSPPPDWLPEKCGGVLGIIDHGDERKRFEPDFAGMLTQGNCAIKRSAFLESGPYPDALTTAEDRWIHNWLRTNGKLGYYCPDLIIHHVMQDERLNRAYFRAWMKREGHDLAETDRAAGHPNLLTHPWYWKEIATKAAIWLAELAKGKGSAKRGFEAELRLRQAWFHLLATLQR